MGSGITESIERESATVQGECVQSIQFDVNVSWGERAIGHEVLPVRFVNSRFAAQHRLGLTGAS